MTIGSWIIIGVVFVLGIGVAIAAFIDQEPIAGLVVILITLLIVGGIFGGFYWYFHHTASGQRDLKDFQSNINNGLEREITITAEDGRIIYHYEGRCDIESAHKDNHYIKFETEEGKRQIIYYGVQDTVLILEK
jgi:hypothetical protein